LGEQNEGVGVVGGGAEGGKGELSDFGRVATNWKETRSGRMRKEKKGEKKKQGGEGRKKHGSFETKENVMNKMAGAWERGGKRVEGGFNCKEFKGGGGA